MSRLHLTETIAAPANRLRAATLGFSITAAPLCIVALAQIAFLPQIVGAIEGLDGNERTWAISVLRRDWLAFHTAVATSIAIYWLLTAVLGRGNFLQLRYANITLGLFVFAVIFLILYGSFVQWPEKLEGVCPFFGVSDTDAPSYGLDTPSSCGAFAYAAHQMILLALFGLPIALITTSMIVRIVSSRRARPATG